MEKCHVKGRRAIIRLRDLLKRLNEMRLSGSVEVSDLAKYVASLQRRFTTQVYGLRPAGCKHAAVTLLVDYGSARRRRPQIDRRVASIRECFERDVLPISINLTDVGATTY